MSDLFNLLLVVWVTPIVLWLIWFVVCTPLEANARIVIGIGPGCEFGLYVSKEALYWCPFGMISVTIEEVK
jgi:hypothetical protein